MSLPASPSRRRQHGFTLVELAIVLAIAAVLLRLAAPGMSRTVAAHAVAAQAAEFMAALRFARSEAIKRGGAVTLCASAAPGATAEAAAFACQSGRAADWRWGWIVFADPARRGTPVGGGPVLRVQQALARSGGVAGTRAAISFTAAGYSTDASAHFLFAPPSQAADVPPALMVCVSKQGRPRQSATGACA